MFAKQYMTPKAIHKTIKSQWILRRLSSGNKVHESVLRIGCEEKILSNATKDKTPASFDWASLQTILPNIIAIFNK